VLLLLLPVAPRRSASMSWFLISVLVDRLIAISAVERTANNFDLAALTIFGLLIANFSDQLFDFAWILTIGEVVEVFPDQAVSARKSLYANIALQIASIRRRASGKLAT
jgi:hypothetical protein